MGLIELGVPKDAIAAFCRGHGIRRLSLFGSAVRGELGPDSDVDVLVEFRQGEVVGLRIVDVEDDLSRMLGGRRVDVVNPKYLNRHLRDRILASAEVQYAEG
jgi:uncharacterized protein